MMILVVLWLTSQASVVIAELPSLSTEANSSYLTTGDTVVIRCRISNTSLLSFVNEYSIHWWKDGVKLTESSMMLSQDVKDIRYSVRLEVEGLAIASILQITNVRNEDDGSFMCELKDRGNSNQSHAIMITVNDLLGTMQNNLFPTTSPVNLNNTYNIRASSTNYSQETTQSSQDSSQYLPNTTAPMEAWNTSSSEKTTVTLENTTTLSNENATIIMRNHTLWNTTAFNLTTEAHVTFNLTTDARVTFNLTTEPHATFNLTTEPQVTFSFTKEALVNSTTNIVNTSSVSTNETLQNSESIPGGTIGLTTAGIVLIIILIAAIGIARKKYRGAKGRTAFPGETVIICPFPDTTDNSYVNVPQQPTNNRKRAAYEDANETGFLSEYENDRRMTIESESPNGNSSIDYRAINTSRANQSENNVCTNNLLLKYKRKTQRMNSPSTSRKLKTAVELPKTNQKRKGRSDYELWSNIGFLKEYKAK